VSEVRRLRYFLAVADSLNFTRAAEQLHVAQPALSRQIRLLERDLGVELLERSTHSVALTEVGSVILERARAIVGEVDELWAFAREQAAGAARTVVIGYTPSIAYGTAPVLIEALSVAAPDLDVQTTMGSFADVVAGVRDGSLAAGLVRGRVGDDLEARPVRRLRQGVLVSADDPLATASSTSVSALAERPILLHARDDNPGHYDDVVALCREAGFEPKVVERSVSFDPSHTAVRSGAVVAIQAEASSDGVGHDVQWIPIDPPRYVDVQLIVPPGRHRPAVERLVAAVEAAAREQRWSQH
jgi:DNA-binding transcriptional LysR family regulator